MQREDTNMDGEQYDDEKTVTVRCVSDAVWKSAKGHADRAGQSYGRWLTEALQQRMDRETSGLIEPRRRADATLTEDQIIARMAAVTAMMVALAEVKAKTGQAIGLKSLQACSRGLVASVAPASHPVLTIGVNPGNTRRVLSEASR